MMVHQGPKEFSLTPSMPPSSKNLPQKVNAYIEKLCRAILSMLQRSKVILLPQGLLAHVDQSGPINATGKMPMADHTE